MAYNIDGYRFETITPEAMRAEAVRKWGEAKVAANEAEVKRIFGKNAPS